MSTIDSILSGVLVREGWPTFTNHPWDRGGPSKGPIRLKTLEGSRGRRCSVQELKNLSEREAREILRKMHVLDPGLHHIADDALRTLAVDYAVHSGPDDSIKALQRALGVTADGALGPKTRAALASSADSRVLYRALYLDRWRKLEDLVIEDPLFQAFLREHDKAQAHNLRGWGNRLREFLP